MQNSQNEDIRNLKAGRLKTIRQTLQLSQAQMAEKLSTGQSHIGKYESGKLLIGKNVEYKILNELLINPTWWQTGEGEMFMPTPRENTAKIIENDAIAFEELTYINTKARASFMELLDVSGEFETYRVFKSSPDESYVGQIVIEIGGDSMEPNYWDGCKVRCKEIQTGDWVYLNSGVYAVAYGNFFVVKRIKNAPIDGKITLYSDNTETGGSTEIPLSKVRKIWRVLRIVDAPAR